MLFDMQVQVIGVEAVPTDGGTVQLQLAPAITLPGPQGIALLPMGLIRVNMRPEAASQLAEQLTNAAEGKVTEDKPSDIIVAKSLAGVDQAAQVDAKLKGK